MYEAITAEGIKSEILARLTNTELQIREGSFTNDVVSAVALELFNLYHSLDALLPMFYLDDSSGSYIDLQAGIVGIVRKAGSRATCAITFTGTDGASVPAGMAFYTASGLAFTLDAAVEISGGTAAGALTAEAVGVAYNITAGEIVNTLKNSTGITAFSNAAASGGTDAETDAALLTRYLAKMRNQATSGNPAHYQQWAETVDGVGAARIVSKWNGAGTVKVILASQAMESVASSVVTAVSACIETQRPVGAAVAVVSATERSLALAASVSIDGTTTKAEVQAAFEAAVKAYCAELAQKAFADTIDLDFDTMAGKTYSVNYNHLVYLLLSIAGVTDYSALTVNAATASITVAADEVPVVGEVSVS